MDFEIESCGWWQILTAVPSSCLQYPAFDHDADWDAGGYKVTISAFLARIQASFALSGNKVIRMDEPLPIWTRLAAQSLSIQNNWTLLRINISLEHYTRLPVGSTSVKSKSPRIIWFKVHRWSRVELAISWIWHDRSRNARVHLHRYQIAALSDMIVGW